MSRNRFHYPTVLLALCVTLPALAQVQMRVEHHPPEKARRNSAFVTVPNLSPQNNVARDAIFSVVEGNVGRLSGGLSVLNDGNLADSADAPKANFFFDYGSLEGRFRADLHKPIPVAEIRTYSWHKSDRGPQLYKVYGSDGSAANFNPAPAIGVNPTHCGWTLIANVDTRPTHDPVGGQYAVSIADSSGTLGTYRYLLFATFVTETHDDWGHTFFSEIEVIRSTEGK